MGHVRPLQCPDDGVNPPAAVAGFTAARPLGQFLPPMPPPASVRGHRALARVLVDSTGVPVRDSITVCGISDASYARDIGLVLARLSFEPARQDGVARRAPAYISFEF
jgi:hypothetical protein